jgi:hypothetical protein
VVSLYKMASLIPVKPAGTGTNFLFSCQHTDSGNLVTVNTPATLRYGAGFTISSYKQDYFGAASLTGFPGVTATTKCI